MDSQDQVISAFDKYLRDFIEVPHPAFGWLPVCPFAARARREKRIKYVVAEFEVEWMVQEAAMLPADQDHDLVIMADPRKDFPLDEVRCLLIAVTNAIGGRKLLAFDGHPLDDTRIAGTLIRKDPYPNIQVIKESLIAEGRRILKKTGYYDRWDPGDFLV